MNFDDLNFQDILDKYILPAMPGLFNIILTIILFFVGLKLINFVVELLGKVLKDKVPPAVTPFLKNAASIGLKFVLVIVLLAQFGIETTSLATLIGSLGVGIGLALTGSLQNFASALMILIFKPFSVNDWITYNGNYGQVKEIQIFNTIINTADGANHYVPNSLLTTAVVENHSDNTFKRMEFVAGIAYAADMQKARELIKETVQNLPFVEKSKEVTVGVNNLNDSSVDLTVWYWIDPSRVGDALVGVAEPVKNILDKNNIEIPFPQRDVHMIK